LVATTPRATYAGRDWRTFWGWKINAGSCANRRKSYESQLNMFDKAELRCTGFAQTAFSDVDANSRTSTRTAAGEPR
jgi:hypothetical protein